VVAFLSTIQYFENFVEVKIENSMKEANLTQTILHKNYKLALTIHEALLSINKLDIGHELPSVHSISESTNEIVTLTKELGNHIDYCRVLYNKDDHEVRHFQKIEKSINTFTKKTNLFMKMLSNSSNHSDIFHFYQENLHELSENNEILIRSQYEHSLSEVKEQQEQFKELMANGRNLLVAGTFIILMLIIGIVYRFSRSISTPLLKLKEQALSISSGKYDTEINIKSKDEIGQLAQTFNLMARAISKEISGRKLSEENAKRFSRILEGSLNEIYIFDAKTLRFVEVNLGARENIGYSIKELINLTPLDLKHNFTTEEFEKLLSPLRMGEKEKIQFTTVHFRKDGTQYPVEAHLQLMTDGTPLFVAIILDITKRRAAELTTQWNYQTQKIISTLLQVSLEPRPIEEQLNKALELILKLQGPSYEAKGGVFLMDSETKELTMLAHQGLDAEIIKACAKIPENRCLCGKAIASKSIIFTDHVDARHENSYQGMSDHGHYCVPISNNSKILGILCLYLKAGAKHNQQEEATLQTIANTLASIINRNHLDEDLYQAKAGAERANNAKSDFLAHMSHEIRTPLNAILGMNEVLMESDLGTEQKKHLQTSRNAGETLLALINDVLDLSKIEAGQIDLVSIEFNLHEMINNTANMQTLAAKEKGIDFKVELDPKIPEYVKGDPDRLRQILLNLLNNAIKFTISGGVVFSIYQKTDQRINFTIQDTGIGISEEHMAHIFRPFVQADSTTTRHFGGTGLGLTICKQLVEAMGGSIDMESRFTEGSSFHISIDLPPSNLYRSQETLTKADMNLISAEKEPPKESLNILLVDDAEENRMVVIAFLKQSPHHVIETEDGAEAVAAFKEQEIDLILIDMLMPVMDGYDATRAIREHEQALGRRPVPIIALTAQALKEDLDKTLEAGCDFHLTKPIRKDQLIKTIDRLRIKYTNI
jgi:PAS domain S-box-containing protein